MFLFAIINVFLGAIEVTRYKIKELGVSWNESFRKHFSYQRWESVKKLQWYLGELPFEMIYDLSRWKFLINRLYISSSIDFIMNISELQFGHLVNLSATYGPFGVDIVSNSDMTACVDQLFSDLIVDCWLSSLHRLFCLLVCLSAVALLVVYLFVLYVFSFVSVCVFLPSWRININKRTNKHCSFYSNLFYCWYAINAAIYFIAAFIWLYCT